MSRLRAHLARMVYGSSRLQQIRQMSQTRSPRVLWRSIQWFIKGMLVSETVLKTRHGSFHVSTQDTAVARDLYIHGKFEDEIVNQAFDILTERNLLRDGKIDVLLDVGANIGITSISFLSMGKVRRAVAMEPDARNYKLLTTNIRCNDAAESIMGIQSAISNYEGLADLELSATNFGDHRIRLRQDPISRDVFAENLRKLSKVDVKTLDGVVASLPQEFRSDNTLLWMDVQGHECHVIDGASALLSRGIPVVMELWPYGMQRAGVTLQDLHGRLVQNWKEVASLDGNRRLRPIHEWRNIANDLTTPGDYTNLLLLP